MLLYVFSAALPTHEKMSRNPCRCPTCNPLENDCEATAHPRKHAIVTQTTGYNTHNTVRLISYLFTLLIGMCVLFLEGKYQFRLVS